MNFENWEYHESKLPKDHTEKEKLLGELKIKFKEEASSNEAVKQWLQQFDEKQWDNFIGYYADFKVTIIKYSSVYIEQAEKVAELEFRDKTEKLLEMILQKKLFNLQCQWRAELITLPDIRICYDFWYWGSNIRNCPFLDSVSDTEIELIQQYIKSDDFDVEYFDSGGWHWQNYEDIHEQEKSDEDDEVLQWYSYYDTYMGTGSYMLLPDVRGPKEEVYLAAWRAKEAADKPADPNPPKPYIPTPQKEYLWYSVHRFSEMAAVFDDPYFKTLIKANSDEEAKGDALEDEEGESEHYVHMLQNLTDLPPVRGGVSWRQALRFCYEDYLKSIITRDLPTVCEEYHLYRSMGFRYELEKYVEESIEDHMISKHTIERILKGREALGEPADLNF